MKAERKIQIRCDQDFLDVLDDWRAEKRPILSRSAALRHLVCRGVLEEKHLADILRHAVGDLADAKLIGARADEEIYKRFQTVVLQTLDDLAHRHRARGRGEDQPDAAPPTREARETPDPGNDERDTQSNFRRVVDRSS